MTTAISPPQGQFLHGLSVAFNTGADHALEEGAIVKDVVALHVQISAHWTASVSSQIAALKSLFLDDPQGEWKAVLDVSDLLLHYDWIVMGRMIGRIAVDRTYG